MKCNVCGEEKTREEFPKILCGRCKECKYEYTRKWKSENRDKVNNYDKKWRKSNYETYLESQRKTYHKNIEKRRKYSRELWHKMKEIRGYDGSFKIRNGIEVLKKMDKCEICGTKETLQVHHKDNQGRHNLNKGLKPNNKINNLQILCRVCHATLHARSRPKIYGQTVKKRGCGESGRWNPEL